MLLLQVIKIFLLQALTYTRQGHPKFEIQKTRRSQNFTTSILVHATTKNDAVTSKRLGLAGYVFVLLYAII